MQGSHEKIGYSRAEFRAIFQVYAKCVYTNLFKDFSFSEINGQYFISFREEAGKKPLITIEKQKLGPDRSLFIATSPGPRNTLFTVARSEKISAFIEQLNKAILTLSENKHGKSGKSGKISSKP